MFIVLSYCIVPIIHLLLFINLSKISEICSQEHKCFLISNIVGFPFTGNDTDSELPFLERSKENIDHVQH